MPLTTCEVCSGQMSADAPACPHCGHPTGRPVRAVWGFEWRTRAEILGWPLIHVAVGRDAATGRRLVAKGVIAVGQFAVGVITVAQFGLGLLFCFGQFGLGFVAVAQFAAGIYFGLGQFACGYVAIGQFAVGTYVLAQLGFGDYVWDLRGRSEEAYRFFRSLFELFAWG